MPPKKKMQQKARKQLAKETEREWNQDPVTVIRGAPVQAPVQNGMPSNAQRQTGLNRGDCDRTGCACKFCTEPIAENICEAGDNSCHVCLKVRQILDTQIAMERELHNISVRDLVEEIATLKDKVRDTTNKLMNGIQAKSELELGMLEGRRAELEELYEKKEKAKLKAEVADLREQITQKQKQRADVETKLKEAEAEKQHKDLERQMGPLQPLKDLQDIGVHVKVEQKKGKGKGKSGAKK